MVFSGTCSGHSRFSRRIRYWLCFSAHGLRFYRVDLNWGRGSVSLTPLLSHRPLYTHFTSLTLLLHYRNAPRTLNTAFDVVLSFIDPLTLTVYLFCWLARSSFLCINDNPMYLTSISVLLFVLYEQWRRTQGRSRKCGWSRVPGLISSYSPSLWSVMFFSRINVTSSGFFSFLSPPQNLPVGGLATPNRSSAPPGCIPVSCLVLAG